MRYKLGLAAVAAVLALSAAAPASAATLVEDFEGDFPAWESGWLATNSNIQNYYGVGQDRGNNPDGLWIADGLNNGSDAVITFNGAFASSLSSFAVDVASHSGAILTIWDKAGATLLSTAVSVNSGALSDPGTYSNYAVASANGIGGFSFVGSAEGNLSIDNVVVNQAGLSSAVPEPATWAMMIMGFGLAGSALRRRRAGVAFA